MARSFALTDIHGCRNTLLALLEQLHLRQGDSLYFLGDYVDRGPDSKGVIDTIFELQDLQFKVHCLRGNHEQLVLDAATGAQGLENWVAIDGKNTFHSFGVNHASLIPPRYLNWMNSLPYFIELDQYILVHAGLNFFTHDPLWEKDSMIWIRKWYEQINYGWLGKRVIVHGHTPMIKADIEQQFEYLDMQQYLDIDGGCVYGNRPGREMYGQLVAFDLTNRQLYFQKMID